MSSRLRILVASAFCSAAASLPAQDIVAYHDAATATHLTQIDTLTKTGYRPITLTIYGTAQAPLHGAVWVHRAGPKFLPFHGLTSAEYQSLVVANAASFVPTIVSACGAGASARFAGVLEATGDTVYARHDQTKDQFDDEVKLARTNGWRIASADVYGTSGDPRYIVSFRPNPQQVGWGYYTAVSAAEHQDKFNGLSQAWARPVAVAFNDDSTRFLACWEDTIPGQCVCHHDMTSATYQQLATQYLNVNSRYPIYLAGSGSGSAVRLAAVWCTTDVPMSRQWTVTGTSVPALSSFDAWVQNWMQSGAIRGAALAIAKDGKLKLARGYTWAEPGYAPVQPTSLFRIASCNKPLTSITIHQQIASTPSKIGYGALMADAFGNPTMADSRANDITVEHLLTHRGGWDRTENGSNYDPMFIDGTVANALSVPFPVSCTSIRTYMQGQMLDFKPGTATEYSNYGFTLLARMLEVANPGKTFPQILQQRVFDPLGITRPRVGRSHFADRLPGEVLYHPRGLGVAKSVNDDNRPYVASHYGGWNQENMDGHGAYVVSAPDYAKVLAAFDLWPMNPILGTTQTTNMWTLGTGAKYLRGWMLNSSTSSDVREHTGALPGTRTYIGRRADGVSFVFFTNGDETIWNGNALSALADAVSAWPAHDLFPSVGLPSFQRIDGLMAPIGSGCPGSLGLARLSGSGSADLGQRLSLDLASALPGAGAACVIGLSRTVIDLTAFGAPGCTVHVSPVLSAMFTTSASGGGSLVLNVPTDPGIVGAHVFAQDVVLDPRANLLGLYLTAGLDVTVGGWLGR